MIDNARCLLCDGDARKEQHQGDWSPRMYECVRCGSYAITETLSLSLEYNYLWSGDDVRRMKVSAFTRSETVSRKANDSRAVAIILTDRSHPVEGALTIEYVIGAFPRTVSERLDKTLLNLALMSGSPGVYTDVFVHDTPVAYVSNPQALGFMLWQLEEQGLLRRERVVDNKIMPSPQGLDMPPVVKVLLTAKGWGKVAELEQGHIASKPYQAFVAMWFSHEVEIAYDEGFYKGVLAAGYDPVRIDREVHNNRIDDQIIAEIRKSRFVVADFTGARPSVYYEAGFAQGLGLEVIWCCREDWMDRLHFDTRQYPHIVWSTPGNLHTQLKTRIEALIGPGVRREQR